MRYFQFIPVLICVCAACNKQPVLSDLIADEVEPELEHSLSARSPDEAVTLALQISDVLVSTNQTKSAGRNVSSVQCVTKAFTKVSGSFVDTLMYVVNFGESDGFAIINADRHADPFICCTESGQYDYGEPTGVEGFDSFIDHVENVLNARKIAKPLPIVDTLQYAYDIYRCDGVQIEPLVKVTWGQGDIYGAYCPNKIAGCAATAVAQVMSYFKAPASFKMSLTVDEYEEGNTLLCNWLQVLKHTKKHFDNQDCDSIHPVIGALMRELGYRMQTSYGSAQSSTYYYKVTEALSSFGFSYQSSNMSQSSVISSLVAGSPAIILGQDATRGGHFYIIDGCKDYALYKDHYEKVDYTVPGWSLIGSTLIEERHSWHINWGWDGQYNGYFSFGVFKVCDGEEYDSEHGSYNYNPENSLLSIYNLSI